ncbi:MAG: DEAD/DEAH box helicase, partial [Verrucomicrobiae bacterium]|nr:DEAD/DEAH box helicase [Verrucomicrobiae bacterium]
MQDIWQYSTVHNSACKVIEEQTLWGQTVCRVWLPNQDAVVRVPLFALRPLSADLQPEIEAGRIAYVAAAAKVAEVLEGSISATDGHVLLAPMESNVIPLPHQIHALSRAISGDRVRYLLADEVGLGKTIEAGLAIRSLHLCGLAERVLIAAPASLCQQWQREMASKFLMPFARATSRETEWIFPEKQTKASPALFEENLAIVSTALLTRKERQTELKGSEPFDIALVDEAHYARRSNLRQDGNERLNPKFNRLLAAIDERLRKKTDCLWLATATPMQLDQIEIADLISVAGRVGSFQFDPSLTQAYYDILAKLVRERDPSKDEWEFLRRAIIALQSLDPLLWEYLDNTVVDPPIRNAVRRWIERGHVPKGTDRNRIRRYVFAASPLARVMLRHTRKLLEVYRANGELGANLARRTILPLPRITFTSQEKQAYEQLEEYCEGLKKQIERNTRDTGKRVAMGFYLSFLRLRFASSLHAIRETVRRRRMRVLATLNKLEEDGETTIGEDTWRQILDSEDEREEFEAIDSFLKDRSEADLRWELNQLKRMAATLEDLSGLPSKLKELLLRIDKRRDNQTHRVKQMVIFSRFFDTVSAIRDRLRHEDPHMLIGTYSGQGAGGQYVDPKTGKLVNVDRELVKHRFVRGEIDLLICTDAAAEGLNLQSADLLVNYDLPWNPMKVEQRIGRIDRIGQKHEDIYVLNLAYPESAEEIVYDRLLCRLQSAGMVVGEQQFSLLPVTLDEFRDLADGSLTPDELEAKATIRLDAQRIREQSTQIPADELHAIYHRLARDFRAVALPATLADIENALLGSDYLRRIGCVAAEEDGVGRWLTINGLAGVPDGSRLSTSRSLYESGLADGTSVRFASYGDPALHAIFEHMLADDLPPCVRRLEARADDETPPLVGYLVATEDEGLKLLRAFGDLGQLTLNEDYTITDDEAAPFIRELEHDAAVEWDFHRKGATIEAVNAKAAEAQVFLNLMVSHDLLTQKAKLSGETQFWPLVASLDELANARDQLAIAQLAPLSLLQTIEPDLLFEVTAPVMGDHGHMTAPRLLLRTAIDAACRAADSLNLRKGETTVDRVLGRIERETRSK